MLIEVRSVNVCTFHYSDLEERSVSAQEFQLSREFEVRKIETTKNGIKVARLGREELKRGTQGIVVYCIVCHVALVMGIGLI
jgi:hypothetical protein